MQIVDHKLLVTGSVPFADVGLSDLNHDGLLNSAELGKQLDSSSVGLLVALNKKVAITCNGKPLAISTAWVNPILLSSGAQGSSDLSVVFTTDKFVDRLQTVSIQWNFPTTGGSVILQSQKSALIANLNERNTATFTLGMWSAARSFLKLGIKHISGGIDHLLFLIVLALGIFKAAVSRKTFMRATKLVAAFTVGHAVSFSLAYFGLMSIPSVVVEPVIALSISLAAAAAMTKREWERYWIFAAGIGLIHGLGFASSLAQFGVATSQHAAAIVCFNLGVDLAQVVVVTSVAVVLLGLRKVLPGWSESLRIVVLIVAGALGVLWAVARIASALAGVWTFWT